MRKIDRLLERHCWVDVFEASHFMGRMRRLYGPVEFRSISAGSVIIGPEARMEVYGQNQGRPFKMLLKPRRVVVDLAAVLKGAKIRSALVTRDLTVARGKKIGMDVEED